MRTPERALSALAITALALWVAALVTSLPPPAPVIVVQAEPAVPTSGAHQQGAPWAVRLVAVVPGGTAPLDVTGTVQLGNDTVPIERGTARIAHARPGVATFSLVVAGVAVAGSYPLAASDGERDAGAALRSVDGASLEGVAPARRAVTPVHWTPWYGEVALRSAASSPLYPLDGRVSARLASQVVLLEHGTPRVVELRPQASGAALDDGRVLHVDRSGLRVAGLHGFSGAGAEACPTPVAPAEACPTPVTAAGLREIEGPDLVAHVHATEERRVACDLLVDGVVHDAVNVDVTRTHLVPRDGPAEMTTSYRRDVQLRMGATGPDALVVVHCGGLYGGDVGRVALARAAPTGPFAPWLRDLARRGGAPADEPLLALDDDALADPSVARAALARMAPAKVRAPRLDVAWLIDRGPSATLRLAYGVLALAIVAAALALGFARLPQRRGTVIFGAAALGAILGGLYAVLVLLGA